MYSVPPPRPRRWLLAALSALLAALLAITVTPTAALAHPGHEHAPGTPKVLIFTATTQFRHTEAIEQGTPALMAALSAAGIDSVRSEDSGLFLQDAPAGDWTVETRLTGTMLHRWQYAGLLAYGSDDEYVKLDVVADNEAGAPTNLRTELVSEVAGAFGAGGNRTVEIPESSESGWWYLRLTKTGNTYTGWVSDGGVNWTQVGEPVTHAGELNAVGLVAVGPQQQAPVTVAFDWIRQTG